MDNLEKLISQNKSVFNKTEPSESHFDKFESLLDQMHEEKPILKPKNKIIRFSWLKVVAVIAIVLFISDQVYDRFFQPAPTIQFSLSDISDDYREAEQFYATTIASEQANLQELIQNNQLSKEEQEMITVELNELNDRFKQLQKDLATNPTDKRVINAMIQFYQTKANLLQYIIKQLKQVKQQNNQSYEHNKI